jgi:hypothetical protein
VEKVPFLLRASGAKGSLGMSLLVGFFTPAIPNMSMALLWVNSALWQRLQAFPHQSLRT